MGSSRGHGGQSNNGCHVIARFCVTLAFACWLALCAIDVFAAWPTDTGVEDKRHAGSLSAALITFSVLAITWLIILVYYFVVQQHDEHIGRGADDGQPCARHLISVWVILSHSILVVGAVAWFGVQASSGRQPQTSVGVVVCVTMTLLAVLSAVAQTCTHAGTFGAPPLVSTAWPDDSTEGKRDACVVENPNPTPVSHGGLSSTLSRAASRSTDYLPSPAGISSTLHRAASLGGDFIPWAMMSWEARKNQQEMQWASEEMKREVVGIGVDDVVAPAFTAELPAVNRLTQGDGRWRPLFEDPTFGGALKPVTAAGKRSVSKKVAYIKSWQQTGMFNKRSSVISRGTITSRQGFHSEGRAQSAGSGSLLKPPPNWNSVRSDRSNASAFSDVTEESADQSAAGTCLQGFSSGSGAQSSGTRQLLMPPNWESGRSDRSCGSAFSDVTEESDGDADR